MKISNSFINLSDPGVFELFGGADVWEEVSVPQGEIFLKEGEQSQDFYYIVSGSVRVSKSMADKNEKELAVLSDGDFFGENGLLSDLPRTASVSCLTACVFLKLSPKKFQALVKKDAEASTAILLGIVQGLNGRLAVMNDRLMAVYEMTGIVRQYRGNPKYMMQALFAKLSEVLGHKTMILFGMDGLPEFNHPEVSADDVSKIQMRIPDISNQLNLDGAPEYFLEKGVMFMAVHNLNGQIVGILTVELEPKRQDQDIKLLLTIAEQIGHVVG